MMKLGFKILNLIIVIFIISCNKDENVSQKVATPVIVPEAGEYHSAQNITISTSTDGATIMYTTDGSVPDPVNGTEYIVPVVISSTTTFKAIAFKSGMKDSDIAEAVYSITITPPARATHDMAYGGANNVVMFGGGGMGTSNTTFEYDTESHTWLSYDPVLKPSHRYAHTMVYIGGNKIILFGGYDLNEYLNDIWEYNVAEHIWEKITVNGDIMPHGRSEHAMVYTENNITIMFGGSYTDSDEHWLDDTWEFDINTSTWKQYNQSGIRPGARKSHRMAYTGNGKLFLFGGHDGSGATNVLWQYDISEHKWTDYTDSIFNIPPSRFSHAMAKTINNTIIIHGGNYGMYPDFSQRDDLWEFDPITLTWTEYNKTGDRPTERGDHRISYAGSNILVFFGGANNYTEGDYQNRYNDTWEYDITSHTWTEY